MLRYFFAAESIRNRPGFINGLNISRTGEEYLKHQSHYPVVFLTLKELKNLDFASFCQNFSNLMSDIYREHR